MRARAQPALGQRACGAPGRQAWRASRRAAARGAPTGAAGAGRVDVDDADRRLQRAARLGGAWARSWRTSPGRRPTASPRSRPAAARGRRSASQLGDQLVGGQLQRIEAEAGAQVLANDLGHREVERAGCRRSRGSRRRPGDPAARARSRARAAAAGPAAAAARARSLRTISNVMSAPSPPPAARPRCRAAAGSAPSPARAARCP